jgi:polysaccharide biosynthesis/export protein
LTFPLVNEQNAYFQGVFYLTGVEVGYRNFCVIVLLCIVAVHGGMLQANEYIVGPGDVINITVYDNDDLATKVMINGDGMIIMPLLGQVEVGGLAVPEVALKITRLLADGYLVNPQVNVFVAEYRSKKVVILGQVKNPGLIELSGAISFLELLSKAGGLTNEAGDNATVKRSINGSSDVIVIDLISLIERGDISQNIPIQDGDTVNISKGGMCFVTGEVKSPGTYPCGDGTTVLKIIALSGGFTGKASKSGVRIVRVEGEDKQLLKGVPLDTMLKEDDVIVVPESFF